MMRRSSTRRTGVVPTPASNSSACTSTAANKEFEKIDQLFAQFADRDDHQVMGPDGVLALCKALNLDATDVRTLLFAWKLQAGRQGFFTLEEWRKGLKAMRVDSIEKLKKALSVLQQEIANPYCFREFYRFAFLYNLTEPLQKTLDMEAACQLVELVLCGAPHVTLFIQFLKEQKEYKVMNLDQWTAFLRFCNEIKSDLSNYDENQAWPLLLDNFVEWAKSH